MPAEKCGKEVESNAARWIILETVRPSEKKSAVIKFWECMRDHDDYRQRESQQIEGLRMQTAHGGGIMLYHCHTLQILQKSSESAKRKLQAPQKSETNYIKKAK